MILWKSFRQLPFWVQSLTIAVVAGFVVVALQSC